LRQQTKVKGQRITGLGIADDAPIGAHKAGVEGLTHGLEQRRILASVFHPPQHGGHLGHAARGIGEEGGGIDLARHSGALLGQIVHLLGIGVEPISRRAKGADQAGAARAGMLHPSPGRLVLLFQQPPVGIVHIGHPGVDGALVAPTGRARGKGAIQDVGSDLVVSSIRRLGLAQVAEAFVQVGGQVHIEAGSVRKGLRIAQPAQALVTLGAIEKGALGYVSLGPEDVLPQLVRQGAGTLEEAGLAHGRVKSLPAEVREGRGLFQAAHFDVAKAVVGKVRLKHLALGVSAQGVVVRLHGATEHGRVEAAISVQGLGMAQGDTLPGTPTHLETHPTGDILSQVKDIDAALGRVHSLGRHSASDANGRIHLRDQGHGKRTVDLSRLPVTVVESRLIPAGQIAASVLGFAIIDVTQTDGAIGGGAPGAIGGDDDRAPIGQIDLQLRAQPGLAAIHAAQTQGGIGLGHAHAPGIVAVSEESADRIGPLAQQLCYIVGLVLHALTIVGPFGSKDVVAHAAAVEVHLVEAKGRHVERGAAHRGRENELAAQQRRDERPHRPARVPVHVAIH